SPNGKVDRSALPAPTPVSGNGALEIAQTPIEVTLARATAEVLGLERVGIHENFFELGVDSILSMQIVSRARRAGLVLNPGQLFQFQTISELAPMVESAA